MSRRSEPPATPPTLIDGLRALADRALPPEILALPPRELHRARLTVIASALATATALTSTLWTGILGSAEIWALGAAISATLTAIPLLWWTRRADPAASAPPFGLFAYIVISTYGSAGQLPLAATMLPITAFLAGLLCSPRAAALWLVALWVCVPASARLSPEWNAAPSIAAIHLGAGLIFAVPALFATMLYRGMYERLLADQRASARAAELARERQTALDARVREAERFASLGRMAGGLAHDFNNILAAISGSAELIALSQAGPGARAHTERIHASVSRAAALVKLLLDFTGRGRRALRRVRLRERLSECERLLQAGLPKHVSLAFEAVDDVWVEADSVQVDQLLVELVQNAARAYHGKPGVVEVELAGARDTKPSVLVPPEGLPARDWAVLRVRDFGSGIAPEALPNIFDPFFSRESGRRGLGLAAVLGIVRGHGGGIAVESTLGGGTRMTIYLPCEAPPAAELAAAERGALAELSFRGLRVLVVDDEEAMRAVLRQHLEGAGALVTEASDGAAALERLASGPAVDLAFVDVAMPRVSGTELLHSLRARGLGFPVVLMTGHAEVDLARFGNEANVALLLKPFRLAEIAAAARQASPAFGGAADARASA